MESEDSDRIVGDHAKRALRPRSLAAWVAAIAAACLLLVVGPLLWGEVQEQYRAHAARPRPVVANDAEIREILHAVLTQHPYRGEPPPPPAPGEAAQPHPVRMLLVREDSACFAEEPDPPRCPSPEFFSAGDVGYLEVAPSKWLRELLLANQSSRRMEIGGVLGTRPVATAKLKEIFSDGGWWDKFYSEFPDTAGFLIISLPVLSEDRRHALIYVSHNCGGHCAVGDLFVLQLGASGWRIVRSENVWIS